MTTFTQIILFSQKKLFADKRKEKTVFGAVFLARIHLSLFYSQVIFLLCNAGQSFSYFQTDSGKSLPPDDEDVKYDLNGTNMGLIWIVTKSKLYEKF